MKRTAPPATHFGGAALNLGHFGAAAAVGLLLVELQVLQPLGQGQFLLDGHAEERVERLLLVLCRRQLPLHLIQLGDVLIASSQRGRGGEGQQSEEMEIFTEVVKTHFQGFTFEFFHIF